MKLGMLLPTVHSIALNHAALRAGDYQIPDQRCGRSHGISYLRESGAVDTFVKMSQRHPIDG